jgi:molybdopterin converting factor small subunit
MTIYLPTPLRRHAGGAREVEVNGATVREAILALKESHPALAEQLWDDGTNDLKKYLSVFLNDENIRNLQGSETPVTGKDVISIIPAIAGGCR